MHIEPTSISPEFFKMRMEDFSVVLTQEIGGQALGISISMNELIDHIAQAIKSGAY